jgi:hypothetical protein
MKTMADNAREVPCRKCCQYISADYTFCPHCGQTQLTGTSWLYHPVSVLILALVALGPFALYLVWKSSQMDRTMKIVMAVLILVYTGVCTYYTFRITSAEMKYLHELGVVLRD